MCVRATIDPRLSGPWLSGPSIIRTLDYLVSIISLVLKIEKLAATYNCACAVVVTYVHKTVFDFLSGITVY